jgi:hypothetical protein
MGEMVILRTHISILWQAQDEMWGTRFCGGQTGANPQGLAAVYFDSL